MLPALTFCNDADFADWRTYREVHRTLGEVGLAAQDSFWLFDPAGSEMALFRSSTREKGPKHEELLEEIRAGRLAILHGVGNFSRTNTSARPSRGLLADALGYLREKASVPTIWTNHGDEGDSSNIGGANPTYQQGDDPSSEVFILDLLLQAGVLFFWTDSHSRNHFVFSVAGGDLPPLLVRERTRSGHEILCFHRFRGALPKAPDAQTLGRQLTSENLDTLVEKKGITVIYQHWGAHRESDGRPRTASGPVFPPESLAALKRLANCRDRGILNVVPLTELLDECRSEMR